MPEPLTTLHGGRFIRVTLRREVLDTYLIDREAFAADVPGIDLTSTEAVGDHVSDELEELEAHGLPWMQKVDGLTETEQEVHEVDLTGRLERSSGEVPDVTCECCGTPTWGVVDDEAICADCWFDRKNMEIHDA